jgi:hypothetical protein
LRVRLGIPRPVTEGVGHYWFPHVSRFPTGELLMTTGIGADVDTNLIEGVAVQTSTDDGETWSRPYTVSVRPPVRTTLPDGTVAGPTFRLYADPPDQARRFVGHYVRFEDAGRRYVCEPWAVRLDGVPGDVKSPPAPGMWSKIWPHQIGLHGDVVSIQGGILTTAYLTYVGDERYTAIAVFSADDGRTWRYRSTIAGPDVAPGAREGPNEATIVRLGGGELMGVVRVGAGREWPLIRAYSADDGWTWSAPERLPAFSVRPSLRRLSNDVIALSTGRPGIYLWLSTEPRASDWHSIDVLEHHNAMMDPPHRIRPGTSYLSADDAFQTTAYATMVETAPGKILLAYDRTPFGWNPVPVDSDERSRVYLLPIDVERE